MAMLEIKDLQVCYGVINAIKGVSFEVNEGEIIALIGANGAGKTTILHTITGLVPAKSGSIMFEGTDLMKTPAHRIVSMGMAHVPEGRRIFQELTVLENLKMGAYTRKDKKEISDTLEMVYKRFPRLEERKSQIAGTLSGGEQQRVAIARALATKPAILLADEPTGNLDSKAGREIIELLTSANRAENQTLILITHDESIALQADRILTISDGRIIRDEVMRP